MPFNQRTIFLGFPPPPEMFDNFAILLVESKWYGTFFVCVFDAIVGILLFLTTEFSFGFKMDSIEYMKFIVQYFEHFFFFIQTSLKVGSCDFFAEMMMKETFAVK